MDRNNFDGVRIALASIVFFAHLAVLTNIEQFKVFIPIFDGNFAVKGFFAVSGFLVTKSYIGSSSLWDYSEKRIRRIYPAYFAAILLCLFVGAITSKLSFLDFFSSGDTFRYIFTNAVFLNFIQPTLPLAFEGNPTNVLNGSLWTIKVEVMLYFCVPFLLLLYKTIGKISATSAVFLLSVLWVYFFTQVFEGKIGEEISRQFPGQLSYFALGALFCMSDRLLNNLKYIAFLSFITLFLVDDYTLRLFVEPIAYSSFVIYLSTSALKSLGIGKYGDISYGIYLYHFPVIQVFIFYDLFSLNVWLGLAGALGTTIGLALMSWHLLEKPLLRRNSHYIARSKSLEQ